MAEANVVTQTPSLAKERQHKLLGTTMCKQYTQF
jgi:hypothetical protein